MNDFVSVERKTLESTGKFVFDRHSRPAPIITVELRPGVPAASANSSSENWQFARARFFSKEAGVTVAAAHGRPLRVIFIFLGNTPEKSAFADDAVKLDPRHNTVVFENTHVRVVRVHFAPGESGPIVDKRPRVIIVLSDSHATVTLPDGHTEVRDAKAGTVSFGNAGRQATNNIGTTPLENIVVELKNK